MSRVHTCMHIGFPIWNRYNVEEKCNIKVVGVMGLASGDERVHATRFGVPTWAPRYAT